jgi:hypothetical protein
MTNAAVPGYAAVAIVWDGTPARGIDGAWADFATDALFQATANPAVDVTAFGWYFTDAANTAVLASGRFDSPFVFHRSGDGIRVEPKLSISQSDGVNYDLGADVAVT